MIKFYDLQRINAQYGEELHNAAIKVIDRGFYIRSKCVEEFERNLSLYIGTEYAVGVGSGYDALFLILKAYMELGELHEGDEVIVPANTFVATVLAITANNLKPVLVDPNPNTFNLDVDTLETYITSRTKAIVVVHLYGAPCWSDALKSIGYKYGLKIIEDNAQAFGAKYYGHKTGSLGNAAAHSFYPTKILGALGDGGAVTTNDRRVAGMVRELGNYGSRIKSIYNYKGVNSRLDEIQAAMLNVKMNYVNDQIVLLNRVARAYCSGICDSHIILPTFTTDRVWHQFVIRTDYRGSLENWLTAHNIETMVHYRVPIHFQDAFSLYELPELPVTERLSETILSLPISPAMSDKEIFEVINWINEWKP